MTSFNKARKEKWFLTSKNDSHIHAWGRGSQYTTVDHLHRHRIDLKRRLALENRGHTHKLLKKEGHS